MCLSTLLFISICLFPHVFPFFVCTLSLFHTQSQLNRSSPYKSPSGAAKPKPKTSGGRKAGGGMSKPWLQAATLKR